MMQITVKSVLTNMFLLLYLYVLLCVFSVQFQHMCNQESVAQRGTGLIIQYLILWQCLGAFSSGYLSNLPFCLRLFSI